MAYKDGWMKRNKGPARLIYGAGILIFVVVLAFTFGADEIREFARDIAEARGWVGTDATPEVKP